MSDKILKQERKFNLNRVIMRVNSHGYGKNNEYKNKPDSVCYSTLVDGSYHSFVTWQKNKRQMKIAIFKYKIKNLVRRLKK